MPIDYSSILKQIDRNNRQGTNNSFFYLVDASDVDFRVDGFISNGAIVGGGALNETASAKYIVTNATNLANILTGTLQPGIAAGDIVEKRDGGWGIHLDASGTYSDTSAGGALAFSKKDKKFYYYNGTTWVEIGAGTLTGDSGAIRVDGTVVYARLADNAVTGVASFNAADFSVGNTGHVRIANPFIGIRDEFGASLNIPLGATFSITGNPGLDVRVDSGGLRFANMGVTAINGLTGSLTLTGDGGAVIGDPNAGRFTARFASTTGQTGVASFNPNNFVVSATGQVRLVGGTGGFVVRDEFGSSLSVALGGTFSVTGSPGLDVRVDSGGLRFANMGVTSLNGMTGAVTLTGSGFFSATGPTTFGTFTFANLGTTGDRLIVATGPTVDPFRNYVRFGNAWIQTGVAAVAQGPQGTAGAAGATGSTGATGATGSGITGLAVVGGFLQGQYAFPSGAPGPVFNIGYVQGTTGSTGSTGSTGQGVTGFRLITAGADRNLAFQYLFADGSTSAEVNLGNVRGPAGNDGTQGAAGATGSTGTTGSTGQGVTGFRLITAGTDRNLAFQYLFANGSTSAEVNLGNVRGPAGNNGAAGVNAGIQYLWKGQTSSTQNDSVAGINRGGTAIYLSGFDRFVNDQRPYIRVFDDSTSPVKGYLHIRPETSVAGPTAHMVFRISGVATAAAPQQNTSQYEIRGTLLSSVENGVTGSVFPVDSYVAIEFAPNGDGIAGEPQTYTSRSAPTMSGSGVARKVAFLQADGSLTFDYVKTYDLFNPSEFQFAITSFTYTVSSANIGGPRRIGSGPVNISASAAIAAAYRAGTTVNAASVGIVNASAVAPTFNQFYALPSPFTSNSGAATNLGVVGNVIQDVTVRLRATGQGSGDPSPVLRTSDITMQFRNEFLYGMTSAICLTAGTSLGNSLTVMRTVNGFGGLTGDFTSATGPVDQIMPTTYATGYQFSIAIPAAETAVYGYFAIPKRIHNQGNLKFYVEGSLQEGGFVRQGEGLAAACGGTSTMSFTNQSGYQEDYVVYRSEQPVSGAVTPYDVVVTK